MIENYIQKKQRVSKIRNSYTLIEMLVVMAVFAILVSMFFTAIEVGKKRMRTNSCLANQKNIGVAMSVFTGDNKGKYPAGNENWTVTWDDRLSAYDGRNLSQEQIDAARLVHNEDYSLESQEEYSSLSQNEMYRCPEDDGILTRQGQEFQDLLEKYVPNSYGINGNVKGPYQNVIKKGEYTGIRAQFDKKDSRTNTRDHVLTGISKLEFSRHLASVEDMAGTIAIADAPANRGLIGYQNMPSFIDMAIGSLHGWCEPSVPLDKLDYPDYHGVFKANYLFCDGRAATLDISETTSNGNVTGTSGSMLGMWTTKADD